MAQDELGRPRVALHDEPRAMALLATAYERPVEACVLAKLRRACDLWNEGEKALAHIHLAHAGLPPCGPDQALRLFVADELIDAGVAPAALMKAQGFDPAPPGMLKFFPGQPRVPAGNGRESGEWTRGDWSGGDGNITPVAFRGGKERRRHRGGGGGIDSIRSFLEHLPELLKPKEGVAPQIKPFRSLETDLPRPGKGEEVSIPGLPDSVKGIDTTYRRDGELQTRYEPVRIRGRTLGIGLDGKVLNFTKDGAKYTVRDDAKSTGGFTADFFHPLGDWNDRHETQAKE